MCWMASSSRTKGLEGYQIVKYLVGQCKADVNQVDKYGQTPLHSAVNVGWPNLEIIEYLVDQCQANVNQSDSRRGGTKGPEGVPKAPNG